MSAAFTQSAAKLYEQYLTKPHFYFLFEEFISDTAAVGRDGTRVSAFKQRIDSEIDIAIRKINLCSYRFTSYREKLILKGSNQFPRQISIPTIRDKLVLKFLSELLADIYPDHVSQPPHAIVKEVAEISGTRPANYYYLRLDIQSFYPTINHNILMRILRRKIRKKEILHLIKDALATPTGIARSEDNRSNIGVPQGLSISNILSSLYLSDLDKEYLNRADASYFRFVDDILVIAEQRQAVQLSEEIPEKLRKLRGLNCHKVNEGSKSKLVPLSGGIDYLGYNFREDNVEVRESSFKKMFVNMMKNVTIIKYQKNKRLAIWRMNLRIAGCQFNNRRIGWLFFFAQTNNVQQLKQLDAFVQRHTNKILGAAERQIIKRFTKAYFEIRYNSRESKYWINFDAMDRKAKERIIEMLMPEMSKEQIEAMDEETIEKYYRRCIRREVGDLEKDMMAVFS